MLRLLATSLTALCLIASAANAQPGVAVSIKPVELLVADVMKGIGKPDLILAPNASPHQFVLKPSQRRIIENAKVLFIIGDQLETPLAKVIAQRKSAGAVIVELMETPGLEILKTREAGLLADDHGAHKEHGEHEEHAGHEKHDGHEEHDEHGSHDGDHDHGAHDPHIWLDPENAVIMIRIITATLATHDPAHAVAYKANATAAIAAISKTQSEIAASLAPVRDKPFVVFHDSYQYFEHRFGLTTAGTITIDPGKRPGAKRLRDIHKAIADNKVVCVFAEPQFEVSYVTTVIEGTNARTAQLDPIGINATTYTQLLTNNAAAISGCLGK